MVCGTPYHEDNCKDVTGASGVSHIDLGSLYVHKEYIFVQVKSSCGKTGVKLNTNTSLGVPLPGIILQPCCLIPSHDLKVASFFLSTTLLALQRSTPFSTQLYVSHKRGQFRRAHFPANRHPQDIRIVNADEGQVFIAGNHMESSVSLYLSDPTGIYYVSSLERLLSWRQASGAFYADLHEVCVSIYLLLFCAPLTFGQLFKSRLQCTNLQPMTIWHL